MQEAGVKDLINLYNMNLFHIKPKTIITELMHGFHKGLEQEAVNFIIGTQAKFMQNFKTL